MIIRHLPSHLTQNTTRKIRLRRWANLLRGLYGVPIYLCGSALIECNKNPRDWDIRVEMPDEDFRRRFGDPQKWEEEESTGQWTEVRYRWSDECVKRSKEGWRAVDLNMDFQIYPLSYCERLYRKRPKIKLDTFKKAKIGAK